MPKVLCTNEQVCPVIAARASKLQKFQFDHEYSVRFGLNKNLMGMLVSPVEDRLVDVFEFVA